MEIILSIFLTLEVKSYLIITNFWKIVRILMISEKSDLGTHSANSTFIYIDFEQETDIQCNIKRNSHGLIEIERM